MKVKILHTAYPTIIKVGEIREAKKYPGSENYFVVDPAYPGELCFYPGEIELTNDAVSFANAYADGKEMTIPNVGGIKVEQGEKREFDTGAKKQPATGKGTPVLFPPDAYLEISKHFEDGAAIYDARNWEKGIPLSELLNSCERHIAQEKMGLTDERHDRAFVWCAVVYLATKLRIQAGILPAELADIPNMGYDENPKDESVIENQYEYMCDDCQHKFNTPIFNQKKPGTNMLLNGCPECGCSSYTGL